MKSDSLKLAQETIQRIQHQFETFRKESYKTVHDKIGSTLSAASIKTKLITDKTSDAYLKAQLQETHAIIKECMGYVTTLNKELKQNWIPQGPETILDDLRNEFKEIEHAYGLDVKLHVSNDNQLKILNFSEIILIYEWIQEYIKHAISRLAQQITIEVKTIPNKLEWTFIDFAPISPDQDFFQTLLTKTKTASGNFQTVTENSKNISKLTFPTEAKR